MWQQFKQWQKKVSTNKGWGIGAIATPVLFGAVLFGTTGILGSLPERQLRSDDDRLVPNETAPLIDQPRDSLIGGFGAIATIAGGAFLLLNVRRVNRNKETANLRDANLSGADLNGVDFSGVDLTCADLSGANLSDADLSDADLRGADLSHAFLSGANLSHANLSGANLVSTNFSGANLNSAILKYADLSDADLRYANLRDADLRYANLSDADLNCTFLSGANLSDANLSGALLFFINSRDALNLEPLQLAAKPSPFLCNVALPSYSSHPDVNPNRDCARIPHLLSDRYDISLEEAQEIVDEARQHPWD
jgi:uncharacterized protein YjbI with pentapeptide repeats